MHQGQIVLCSYPTEIEDPPLRVWPAIVTTVHEDGSINARVFLEGAVPPTAVGLTLGAGEVPGPGEYVLIP
jgi:hypothetical protein